MKSIKNLLCVSSVLMVLLASSCRTKKDVSYFQVAKDTASQSNIKWKNFPAADSSAQKPYEPIIKQNDIIDIFVSSINPEAASFFNPVYGGGGASRTLAATNPEIIGYLVDAKGEIELPLIGAVKVGGLTVPMIRDTLKLKLLKYLENPSVRVIYQNFKVTILGEVNHPGVFTVTNERITFPEAIGLANDLSIYGNRKNVLIVREENGKKEFGNVDLTSRELFNSPYYFLHPNDVIYVEPVGAKVESSDNFFRWYSFALTNITFLLILLNYTKK